MLKNQQFNAETDVPPMVWKLDYNVFSSSAIDIMDEAQNGISYWGLNYPFSEPKFSYKSVLPVWFLSQPRLLVPASWWTFCPEHMLTKKDSEVAIRL